MINKIITLDNQEQYLILFKETYLKDIFYIGVKLNDDKYINQFKLFLEKKNNEELFVEEIEDSDLLTILVNKYMLQNIK